MSKIAAWIYTGVFTPDWDLFLPEITTAIHTAYNNNSHHCTYGYDRQNACLWGCPDPIEPLYNYEDLSIIRARQTKLIIHRKIRIRMSNESNKYQIKHNISSLNRPTLMLNRRVYSKHYPKIGATAKFNTRC